MTHDEVKKLSYEELRVKAAELAEWRLVEGCWVAADEDAWVICHQALAQERRPPDYPRDIAAAMELWDMILAGGKTMELFSRRPGSNVVAVGVLDEKSGAYAYDEVEADTAPLAITRAFLLAMPG
jgi:hypothetical protein